MQANQFSAILVENKTEENVRILSIVNDCNLMSFNCSPLMLNKMMIQPF